MWETFSQGLSISIIHASITETACVNNKKELDLLQKLITNQFDHYMASLPPTPSKSPERAG